MDCNRLNHMPYKAGAKGFPVFSLLYDIPVAPAFPSERAGNLRQQDTEQVLKGVGQLPAQKRLRIVQIMVMAGIDVRGQIFLS